MAEGENGIEPTISKDVETGDPLVASTKRIKDLIVGTNPEAKTDPRSVANEVRTYVQNHGFKTAEESTAAAISTGGVIAELNGNAWHWNENEIQDFLKQLAHMFRGEDEKSTG